MSKKDIISAGEVKAIFKEEKASWFYDGPPRKDKPHAKLTTGACSDGFINVGKVLKEDPLVRNIFADNLVNLLLNHWNGRIDRVVGASTSSTDLARDVATILGAEHIKMIKVEEEEVKFQVWAKRNLPLEDGENILHIEELITTSFSALNVRKGIRLANPGINFNFVPFLPTIVERSDPKNRVKSVERSRILSLLSLSINNYFHDCPYCLVGSEALRPKLENWEKLTKLN